MLTTDKLSLPEVGGEAVAYTGVSATEIADNIRSLLADDGRREALSTASLARVNEFAWAAAANRHLIAYAAASKT